MKYFIAILSMMILSASVGPPGWAQTVYTIPEAGSEISQVLFQAGPGDIIQVNITKTFLPFQVTDEDGLQIIVLPGHVATVSATNDPAASIGAAGVIIQGLDFVASGNVPVLSIEENASCTLLDAEVDGRNAVACVYLAPGASLSGDVGTLNGGTSGIAIDGSTGSVVDLSGFSVDGWLALSLCQSALFEDCALSQQVNFGGDFTIRRSDLLGPAYCNVPGSTILAEDCSFSSWLGINDSSVELIRCDFTWTNGDQVNCDITSSNRECSFTDCSFGPGVSGVVITVQEPVVDTPIEVTRCTFNGLESAVVLDYAGDLTIQDSQFQGGSRGVQTYNAAGVNILSTEFLDQDEIGVYINRAVTVYKENVRIEGCRFLDPTHHDAVAILLDMDSAVYVARRPTIVQNTIVGWDVGMMFRYFYGSVYADVSSNLIVDAGTYGVLFGVDFPIDTAGLFEGNCVWGTGGCLVENDRGTCSDNFVNWNSLSWSNISMNPPFCGGHESLEDSDYSLRIDSPCASGNRSGDAIGAIDAACAWGALARSTTFGGTATVLEDVYVPEDSTLTLQPGAVLKFDAYDESLSGVSDALNELTIDGELLATGEDGQPILFQSVAGGQGQAAWFGIVMPIASGSHPLDLDWCEFRNAKYGLAVGTSGSDTCVTVTNSVFKYNQVADVYVTGSGHMKVIDNTFFIGQGDGIRAYSGYGSGGLIAGNQFFGDLSFPSNGINFNGTGTYQPFLVEGNLFAEIVNGPGILVKNATGLTDRPVLRGNIFQDSQYGVQVTRGSIEIGGETTDDGNLFQELYTGDLDVQCLGPGTGCLSCIDPAVRVRHNRFIDSGGVPIASNRTASVDAGLVDQATPDPGNNTLLGYGGYCIRNFTPSCGTLAAEGNYFGLFGGSCGSACIWCVSDPGADADPWLCEDPNADGLGPSSSKLDIVGLDTGAGSSLNVIRTPIPGTGVAKVEFEIQGEPMAIRAELLDLSGRLVRDLGQIEYAPGRHELQWEDRDGAGRSLAAGIRFLRLSTDSGIVATAKVLSLKGGR